jgi:alkaline phosphatase D
MLAKLMFDRPRAIGLGLILLLVPGCVPGPAVTGTQNPKEGLRWAGPMVGHTTAHSAQLWVQTAARCSVQYAYWPAGQPGRKTRTPPASTRLAPWHINQQPLGGLEPDTRYRYRLFLNGRAIALPFVGHFRTPPAPGTPADTVRIVAGSCKLIFGDTRKDPRNKRGFLLGALRAAAAADPHIALWLGDNIYLRSGEFDSLAAMRQRYTYERALPAMQPLLGTAANYATWDDHDFGPNDTNGTFPYKPLSLQAFKEFWANPSYGKPGHPGVYTHFRWGDLAFFLVDNRYYRWPWYSDSAQMLGERQMRWLTAGLRRSKASFKFVAFGNQVLNTFDERIEYHSNYHNLFPAERRRLLKAIYEHDIRNVVFLSGDRHFSEFSRIDSTGEPTLYELTASPYKSTPTSWAIPEPSNTARVEGSRFAWPNFGYLEVTGPPGRRKLSMTIRNRFGQPKRTWTIEQHTASPSQQ